MRSRTKKSKMGSSNIENKINKDQEPNFKNERLITKFPKTKNPKIKNKNLKDQDRTSQRSRTQRSRTQRSKMEI